MEVLSSGNGFFRLDQVTNTRNETVAGEMPGSETWQIISNLMGTPRYPWPG